MSILRRSLAIFIALIMLPVSANAGQLVLNNGSNAPITCTVDGWTIATGYNFDWNITVQPGASFRVGQNMTRAGDPVINWVNCGGLKTKMMNITPAAPDGQIFLNGRQKRVLNAALYPYLPTLPGDQFEALVAHVIKTYQAQNPDVLLAAQLNEQTNIYSFDNLPLLLSANGLDVIEMDVTYLDFVARNKLINKVTDIPNKPLPVAMASVTINGTVWAIPSWLCSNFIYASDGALTNVKTLDDLLAFLKTRRVSPQIAASFNGSWTLPAMYINGYVQTYGLDKINQSMVMPPDPTVISNLLKLTATCNDDGTNNCTNNVYHSGANGTTEQVFATGHSGSDMGFSEQSFYINYYGPVSPLYSVIAPWGAKPQPLLFADAFVTNSSTCKPGTPCAADAAALTTMMTDLPMKNYIVQSQDLPAGTPWRTLLVATQGFYAQPQIANNPMYQQYTKVFPTAAAYPNNFTEEGQPEMAVGICKALKAQDPTYVCNSGTADAATPPSAANDNAPENVTAEKQSFRTSGRSAGRSGGITQ